MKFVLWIAVISNTRERRLDLEVRRNHAFLRYVLVEQGRPEVGYTGTAAACARTADGTSRRWQATWWLGMTSRISGSSFEQRVKA